MKRLFVFLFLSSFSLCSFSAGIRWTDRYPFHRPDTVKVGEYISKYDGVIGDSGKAMLKGTITASVDDVLLTFNAFKWVPISGLADLGKALVKGIGPAMLIQTLVPLVWDEVLKLWKKNTNPDVLNPSSINASNANSVCHDITPGSVIYASDGSACTKVCANCNNKTSPWVMVNNATWDSEGRQSCMSVCTPSGYWPTIWRISNGYQSIPNYVNATDAEILSALNNYLSNLSNLLDFIQKLIDHDLGQNVYDLSNFDHLNGPSVLSSTNNVTSSGPGGQTSIQTTNTYNITYNTNSVVINKTVTVTTTNPDNTTSTVTTTQTSTTAPGGDTAPASVSENSDFCEDHPEIIACGIGGSLSDVDLPSQNKEMSISSELSSVGACPADITFTVRGHVFVISWSPICSFASSIRPLVILMAWLSAGIFVFFVLSRV